MDVFEVKEKVFRIFVAAQWISPNDDEFRIHFPRRPEHFTIHLLAIPK